MMAARNRDAIFELVVLKEKKDKEKKDKEKGEAQTYQNTGIFRNGLTEAADSRQIESEQGNIAGSGIAQIDGEDGERDPSMPFSGKIDSFDNATYSTTPYNDAKETEKQFRYPRKWPLVLFVSITVILLIIVLLISSLSLASVNSTQLANLEQTAVNNMSYQMGNARFLEMFDSLQTQVKQLNESIQKLNENLFQISQQVNASDTQLAKRIDSIETETEALAGATNQLNLTLSNQASRIEDLRDNLAATDSRLDSATTSFNVSLDRVKSSIGVLETRTSQPVDVFKNCTSVIKNASLLLLESELMNSISTAPAPVTSNNETFISDVRCQIQSSGAPAELIQSTHLEVDSSGNLFCRCTVLQPLSTNGTHEFSDEVFDMSIDCQLVFTRCPRQQQLFRT